MPRRNVILLLTDQQRFDTIHAAGNSLIRTPNLDRLVRMGAAFMHATTPQPVCGPARHSIFTGVDTHTVGPRKLDCAAWHPQGRFISEVLAEAGYHTGGFGKMHFKPLRAHHGFQHFALHEEMMPANACREDDDYLVYLNQQGYGHIRYTGGVRNLLYTQPQISPIPEQLHETQWVADRAIAFIEAFHSHPFFLTASWMQPHWPTHVPEPWASTYRTDEMTMPRYDNQEVLPWVLEQNRLASDLFDNGRQPDWNRIKRLKALYYSSISFIDHQVGRILNALERRHLLEQSLILFTADHGELLADHHSFGKVCAYDPVIRVPLIVSAPDLDAGNHMADDLATLYDLAPTIYDFTGVPPPPQNPLCGRSLLSGRTEVRKRDRVFSEIGDGSSPSDFISVRTRRWKYAFYHAGPLRQLFDLSSDPDEFNNLCLHPTQPEQETIAAELHRSLLEWNAGHGLPSRMDRHDFKAIPPPPIPTDRNSQYDEWVDRLPDEDKAKLWSEARSVYEAIRNETSVDPSTLDLEYWEKARGPGCVAELERLLGRRLR